MNSSQESIALLLPSPPHAFQNQTRYSFDYEFYTGNSYTQEVYRPYSQVGGTQASLLPLHQSTSPLLFTHYFRSTSLFTPVCSPSISLVLNAISTATTTSIQATSNARRAVGKSLYDAVSEGRRYLRLLAEELVILTPLSTHQAEIGTASTSEDGTVLTPT